MAEAIVKKKAARRLAKKKEKAAKPKLKRFDTAFLLIILILLSYGIIMVFSASYPTALQKTGDSLFFIKKHALFVLAGLAAMFALSRVPYTFWRRFALPIFIAAIGLLILVIIPGVGVTLNNATR